MQTLLSVAATLDLPGLEPKAYNDPAALGASVLIAAHTAQHEGRDPSVWQPGLALAAHAVGLAGERWLAQALARIVHAGDAFLETLAVPEPSQHLPRRALATVLGWPHEPLAPMDSQRQHLLDLGFDVWGQEDHLRCLVMGLEQADDTMVASALNGLVVDDEGIVDDWHPEVRPGYEPALTALAATALDRGLAPDLLGSQARRSFWPALAPLQPRTAELLDALV